MTREEAKELLIHILMTYEPKDQYGDYADPEPYEEAVNMAIEALNNVMDSEIDAVETEDDVIKRQDAVNEIHKYFVEEIDKTPTEIDEDGDELYADMPTVNSLLACNKELSKRIKSLPSAEPKIGKWKSTTSGDHYKCSVCGNRAGYWYNEENSCEYSLDMSEWLSDFCPNCGARMEGEEE